MEEWWETKQNDLFSPLLNCKVSYSILTIYLMGVSVHVRRVWRQLVIDLQVIMRWKYLINCRAMHRECSNFCIVVHSFNTGIYKKTQKEMLCLKAFLGLSNSIGSHDLGGNNDACVSLYTRGLSGSRLRCVTQQVQTRCDLWTLLRSFAVIRKTLVAVFCDNLFWKQGFHNLEVTMQWKELSVVP